MLMSIVHLQAYAIYFFNNALGYRVFKTCSHGAVILILRLVIEHRAGVLRHKGWNNWISHVWNVPTFAPAHIAKRDPGC